MDMEMEESLVSPAYVDTKALEQEGKGAEQQRQHNEIKVIQRHQMHHDQMRTADCCLRRRPGH